MDCRLSGDNSAESKRLIPQLEWSQLLNKRLVANAPARRACIEFFLAWDEFSRGAR
jgi:hypothetical protein